MVSWTRSFRAPSCASASGTSFPPCSWGRNRSPQGRSPFPEMTPDAALAGYAAVQDYLFGLKAGGVKFGVDRMRILARRLGNPELQVPCIHVAGTNGKGSVSAMLESILRSSGKRTGLYTSPHLVRLGERVQVDRHILSE